MDKRCSNKNWGLFRLIEKNARYHAFQILLHFEQSNKQLKIIRNNYYDKNNLTQQQISRSFVLSNEVIRWKRRLDYWIEKKLDKLRTANELLRDSGKFWHDECKEAVRDLLGKKKAR